MRFQAFSRFVWTSVSGVFHDHEAKKAFSFAATSRMAVLVYPGEILVVGQNLAAIVEQYSLVIKRGGLLLPTLQVKQIFCLSTGNMKVCHMYECIADLRNEVASQGTLDYSTTVAVRKVLVGKSVGSL